MSLRYFEKATLRTALREVRAVEGFNAKVAVAITRGVGTMACAYAFALLALVSLPSVLAGGQLVAIVAWGAQTFLQLVLLSIIMVGQSVQARASDERATKTFDDTERILDQLDVETAGGLKEVLDAVHGLYDLRDDLHDHLSDVHDSVIELHKPNPALAESIAKAVAAIPPVVAVRTKPVRRASAAAKKKTA